MGKIQLKIEASPKSGITSKNVKLALPYYLSRRGTYIHRVRSMQQHWFHLNKVSHGSVRFWCGNGGLVGEKGRLLASVPPDGVLCATCEGRAIGAGMDGSRKINGREVRYSPKQNPDPLA